MVATPPVTQPQPTTSLVAPAPAFKQARSEQRVRTETITAVDGAQRNDAAAKAAQGREKTLGRLLDLIV